MHIVGVDYLRNSISQEGYFLKLVFNQQIAYFFPYSTEHRDASLPGLNYRDDSAGNALAATIKPCQIDVRLHKSFSPEQVKSILHRLESAISDSQNGETFDVNYGGLFLLRIRLIARNDVNQGRDDLH